MRERDPIVDQFDDTCMIQTLSLYVCTCYLTTQKTEKAEKCDETFPSITVDRCTRKGEKGGDNETTCWRISHGKKYCRRRSSSEFFYLEIAFASLVSNTVQQRHLNSPLPSYETLLLSSSIRYLVTLSRNVLVFVRPDVFLTSWLFRIAIRD